MSAADAPGWVAPMLAHAGGHTPVPAGDDWVYERKLDGIRLVAARRGTTVELWSRNHLPLGRRFPHVAAALARVSADRFVMDGEVVAFDGPKTSFGLLQHPTETTRPVLCAFDLISLLGSDLRPFPLTERKALLAQLLEGASADLRFVGHVTGDAGALLAEACGSGWEGLVAKRPSSTYRSGRSTDWRKLKCHARQELVVGGWTDPTGGRRGFGALTVGYYDEAGLRYAGRVGTGFDERDLRDLHRMLAVRAQPDTPFVDAPRGRGLHWVRPDLVVEVRFTEWTSAGQLRHPSFLGLRTDRPAIEVRREPSP